MTGPDIELIKTYRAESTLYEGLGKISLVMTLGPSGVGKTTLMKKSGMHMVVGDASRKPRDGEINGVDYNFRTENDMLQDIRQGRYVQVEVGPGGDIKGTRPSSYPLSGLATFAVAAAGIPTFRTLPFARVRTAVIVPPDYNTWMERIGRHRLPPDELDSRLTEASYSYAYALEDPECHFVLNDRLDDGMRRLKQVAGGSNPDHESDAVNIAASLLAQLQKMKG